MTEKNVFFVESHFDFYQFTNCLNWPLSVAEIIRSQSKRPHIKNRRSKRPQTEKSLLYSVNFPSILMI